VGNYVHDFRDSNAAQDYEWVELWQPVDPAQTEVWANYYSGSGHVEGTVCVYYQGKTHLAPFTLTATSGNLGADRSSRAASPYWARIDLQRIIQQAPQP
jgi:hypothetical protein